MTEAGGREEGEEEEAGGGETAHEADDGANSCWDMTICSSDSSMSMMSWVVRRTTSLTDSTFDSM